ncbi:MAG: extensin family protein [Deltaproteobacteria bacterium]|nr:extensin family protein [Deltaproteobacteria bacterium]
MTALLTICLSGACHATRGRSGRQESYENPSRARKRERDRLACLLRLKRAAVRYRVPAHPPASVANPLLLRGRLAGVEFRPFARRGSLLADCRLLDALRRTAKILGKHGVRVAVFSNAYSRRRRLPSGRASRHTAGLAIDVHRFVFAERVLTVEQDFARGVPCTRAVQPLNRLHCALSKAKIFDRILTPDSDRAHYNHFHWAVIE